MSLQYSKVTNGDFQTVTVFLDGQLHTTTNGNPQWDEVLRRLEAQDPSVVDLFSPAKAIQKRFESITDRVKVKGSKIFFDLNEIDNSLTKQIVRFLDEGVEDFRPLVNFLEKVMDNPEPHSREQLYDWVERFDVTINPDGNLVLYKGVVKGDREDVTNKPDGVDLYQSWYSGGKAIVDNVLYEGQIPQWVGATVEMPRDEVHHDPDASCSAGLHASSNVSTARGYAGDGTTLEVVVNPRDVVSVPHHGGNKIRCNRYVVVDVDTAGYETAFVDKYSDEYDSYDEEDWDEEDEYETCDECGLYLQDCEYDGDHYDEDEEDDFYDPSNDPYGPEKY